MEQKQKKPHGQFRRNHGGKPGQKNDRFPPRGGVKPGPRKPQVTMRQASDQYWLFGWHAVLAALANPKREVLQLWVGDRQREKLEQEIKKISGRENVKLQTVKPELFKNILPSHAVHQQVAAEVKALPEVGIEAILQSDATGPVLVLDQVSDPQNLGAILRSAAAFGARGVITTERHSAPETGVVAKAAAGALEIVPVATVANLANAMLVLKSNGFWVAGLDGSAKQTLTDIPKNKPIALALGAEGRGLRPLTAERCDILVHIPIAGAVESLNVSNATAIALYALQNN